MDSCPNCQSTNLVRVAMDLTGGSVLFAHCRRCENRWWADPEGDSVLPLRTVLAKAAS